MNRSLNEFMTENDFCLNANDPSTTNEMQKTNLNELWQADNLIRYSNNIILRQSARKFTAKTVGAAWNVKHGIDINIKSRNMLRFLYTINAFQSIHKRMSKHFPLNISILICFFFFLFITIQFFLIVFCVSRCQWLAEVLPYCRCWCC